MDMKQAKEITEWMREKGFDAKAIEYSGRAMYGKTTPAITCSARDAMLIGYAAAIVGGVHWDELPTRVDSMGRDVVYY